MNEFVPVLAAVPLIDIDFTIFLQFGLFLVTAVAGTALLFKPYLRLRGQRYEGIEGAKEMAESMTTQADASRKEYEEKLAAARAQANEERRKIRQEANEYRDSVTQSAQEKAANDLKVADENLSKQVEAARSELLPQADLLAKEIASKLLGRKVA